MNELYDIGIISQEAIKNTNTISWSIVLLKKRKQKKIDPKDNDFFKIKNGKNWGKFSCGKEKIDYEINLNKIILIQKILSLKN